MKGGMRLGVISNRKLGFSCDPRISVSGEGGVVEGFKRLFEVMRGIWETVEVNIVM